MLFNSIEFVLFLPIVFALYWSLSKAPVKAQNLLLWVAGYVFYGWWDWRFLLLLAASTVVDYIVAQQIAKHDANPARKRWLAVSLVTQLGMLAVFKYLNFFIDSWVHAWATVGVHMPVHTLNILLPAGISFYTFQTLSYVLDVYRGKTEPERDIVTFAAFITFFPQLMAGPIERAPHMLPRFQERRRFDAAQARLGIRLIIWGFFKKVAVADNLAIYVNHVWENHASASSLTLVLGALAFTFQIYGDFSGYSDIAIGTGKLFGFDLMQNFNIPYLARSVSEFWKRWHISLSTWFQDYLFMPLAIRWRNGRHWGVAAAVFFTFLASGIWHGANWTFLVWGGYHGLLLALEHLVRTRWPRALPDLTADLRLTQLPWVLGTFAFVCLGMVIFRAPSLAAASAYIGGMLNLRLAGFTLFPPVRTLLYLGILLGLEWRHRLMSDNPIARLRLPTWAHHALLLVLTLAVARWIFSKESTFIYFQF